MKHIIGNTLFLGEVFETDDSVEVYTKQENCSVSILYFTPRKNGFCTSLRQLADRFLVHGKEPEKYLKEKQSHSYEKHLKYMKNTSEQFEFKEKYEIKRRKKN